MVPVAHATPLFPSTHPLDFIATGTRSRIVELLARSDSIEIWSHGLFDVDKKS